MSVWGLILRSGLKVQRAIEHLQALEKAAQTWGKEHGRPGFPCVVEPNPQRTKILVKIAEDLPFPEIGGS